jgi:dimethylhistidine N-methyltransferase
MRIETFNFGKYMQTTTLPTFAPSPNLLPLQFPTDILDGLRGSTKRIPSKYFYDERGSELFERICELDEYYLTRIELQIMQTFAREMAVQLGERVMLIEFGSGRSLKTRILLDQMLDPVAYVPIDISTDHLWESAAELRHQYPGIEILPMDADFTLPLSIPQSSRPYSHAAVYFPGSTIGNFEPDAARKLLCQIVNLVGKDGGLLLGIDLKKDPQLIHAAYNDVEGVTAMFNLNILNHLNEVLNADFDLDRFEHLSTYIPHAGRVETFVVSCCDQQVNVGDLTIHLRRGERIQTEYSYKYTVEEFADFAAEVGLMLHRYWTDPEQMFAVLHLVNEA